jgi:hypothetical protein
MAGAMDARLRKLAFEGNIWNQLKKGLGKALT